MFHVLLFLLFQLNCFDVSLCMDDSVMDCSHWLRFSCLTSVN